MTSLRARAMDRCVCGAEKFCANEFCPDCTSRRNDEQRRARAWEAEAFSAKNYIVLKDPYDIFRPGAELDKLDIAGLVLEGWVRIEVYSKFSKTNMLVCGVRGLKKAKDFLCAPDL